MTRLLVTGATGFLGVPCVARACTDFEVHATARSFGERPGSNLGRDKPRHLSGVAFHPCDLFDDRQVRELLAAVRPTHLLHLAWIATPGVYWSAPENYGWVEASKRLLTAFAAAGGERAVVTGTCAEYDWAVAGTCRETATPTRPATVYGQCKNELREWAEACGIAVVWARLFFLYGPGEHPARLVPSVARSLLAGEPAECSAGTQARDFLHTADVADALVALANSNATGPVNVGSGEPVEVSTVIETVARICGRPDLVRLGVRPTAAGEPPVLVADVSRLRDDLGWRARVKLEDGLREAVDWWRAQRAA